MQFQEIVKKLYSLSVLRNVLSDNVVEKLCKLLETDVTKNEEIIYKYSDFVSSLYKESSNLSTYIYRLIVNDENIAIKQYAKNKQIDKNIQEALNEDLKVLESLSKLTSSDITNNINYQGYLAKWETSDIDFVDEYKQKLERLFEEGYGIYAKYHMFSIHNSSILPIEYPDDQSLDSLIGYNRERSMLIKNTEAFLNGMKASNALLYGDAGTGKSSTVKGIVNTYASKGLRLIEVKKHQLYELPNIIKDLADNPLKFIIFIDDLSFKDNDDNFVALKTILEGGISKIGNNTLIYATTNRRHFVKESMKNRNDDELFTNDSIQETLSLAARFGLTITFQKPLKDDYIEIVQGLAKRENLLMDGEELIVKAEAYALRNHGRSPRSAKQFVELEKIKEHQD